MIGALVAGRLSDGIGRKRTILITAVVFVLGVMLAAFTPTYPILLLARLIIGLAVGAASMVVPLYIGEIAPASRPSTRARTGSSSMAVTARRAAS